jgi:hypothetical protein
MVSLRSLVYVVLQAPVLAGAQRVDTPAFDRKPPSAVLTAPAWLAAPADRGARSERLQTFTRRRGQIVLWSGSVGALVGASAASVQCARRNACLQPLNALVGGVVGATVGTLGGFGIAALYRDPEDPRERAVPQLDRCLTNVGAAEGTIDSCGLRPHSYLSPRSSTQR